MVPEHPDVLLLFKMKAASPWVFPEARTVAVGPGSLLQTPKLGEKWGANGLCWWHIFSECCQLSHFKGFLVNLQGPLNQTLKADPPTKTHDIWCLASLKTRQFHFLFAFVCFLPSAD